MVVGDTHGDIEWCAEVTRLAGRHGATVILQVGDFGYWPRMKTRDKRPHHEVFLGRIRQACQAHRVIEWIVIDGNHEDHWSLAARCAEQGHDSQGMVQLAPNVRYSPRGNTFELGGVTFGTLGGAASIDALLQLAGVELGSKYRPGWDWFPDLEVPTVIDVERFTGKRVDVLLTHEAPARVDLSACGGFPGIPIPADIQRRTDSIRDLVSAAAVLTQPKLIVHGHWHRRYTEEIRFEQNQIIRVEGLAANSRPYGRNRSAYLILELPDLMIVDSSKL